MKKIIHFLKNVCAISFFTLFFWAAFDPFCPIDGGYTLHLMFAWMLLAFIEGMFEV
ncbi:MAG: hypothetical protein BWX65_00975 [Bacteroidetes bacterium ADurb.Bin057]|jgi:hypothetical protein|nr:MAG: hypothetical protein BWX65_00975 [Bacteroidetes bacterium ADurb.Bin057]